MKSAEKLAARIPAEYRKEILDMNMIEQARGMPNDGTMAYLVVIYKNYIEPGFSANCNDCYARCLKNFKAMLPYLVQMEKESNILDNV